MTRQGKTAKLPSTKTDETNRSQTIFIAVGLAIVIGGLFLLYNADGPYHPSIPVTENAPFELTDG